MLLKDVRKLSAEEKAALNNEWKQYVLNFIEKMEAQAPPEGTKESDCYYKALANFSERLEAATLEERQKVLSGEMSCKDIHRYPYELYQGKRIPSYMPGGNTSSRNWGDIAMAVSIVEGRQKAREYKASPEYREIQRIHRENKASAWLGKINKRADKIQKICNDIRR